MSSNEHVLDLLPAYALDCLDIEELVQVSEHLTGCADCRAELQKVQAVVDQLAIAVPSIAPPARLKDRLKERVRPRPALEPTRWQRVKHSMQRVSPVWGLAGLAIILVLALSTLLLWQQVSQLETPAEPAQMRTVALSGTGMTPDATGLIVVSLDGDHGALVVDQLPELDVDRQYQLWLIDNDRRVSGAVFSVDEHGYGSVWISADEPLSSFSAFGISIEPAGGSEGPTGEKVLGGTLK